MNSSSVSITDCGMEPNTPAENTEKTNDESSQELVPSSQKQEAAV